MLNIGDDRNRWTSSFTGASLLW